MKASTWYPPPPAYDPPSAQSPYGSSALVPYAEAPAPAAPPATAPPPPPPAGWASAGWAPPPAPSLPTVYITLPGGGIAPAGGDEEGADSCCGCRCCRPRYYPHLAVPAALALLVSFIVSIIAGSNGGDVFWAGWVGGGGGSAKNYRVTLHGVNTCDVFAGDTFCSDFFSDVSYPLASVPGGAALAALTPQLQATFLGAAALALFSLARLFCRACRGCAPLQRHRCGFGFAGSLALCCAVAAGAGAYMLRRYGAAAQAFAAANAAAKAAPPPAGPLPGVAGLALMGGYACGWVAVAANGAAGLLLLRIAVKARREARREAQRGEALLHGSGWRGEEALRDAGVSVQAYS